MTKVKEKLRTFTVKENFQDPYTGEWRLAGDELQESDLLKSGWRKEDVKKAVNSLLIPHLWPKSEVDNGKSNSA